MEKLLERMAVALEGIHKELAEKNQRSKSVRSPKTAAIKDEDLDPIYALYPRKVGKEAAYKRLKASMTSEDLPLLKSAVESAVSHWRRNGTETQYIPHFSTFAGRWRDHLEAQTITGGATQVDLSMYFGGFGDED